MRLKILKRNELTPTGRIYNQEAIDEIINQFMEARIIYGKNFFGEYPQPERTDVNHLHVTHHIERLELDDDGTLYGHILPLTTDFPKNVKLALRCTGTVTDGIVTVFELLAFDLIDTGFKFLTYEGV